MKTILKRITMVYYLVFILILLQSCGKVQQVIILGQVVDVNHNNNPLSNATVFDLFVYDNDNNKNNKTPLTVQTDENGYFAVGYTTDYTGELRTLKGNVKHDCSGSPAVSIGFNGMMEGKWNDQAIIDLIKKLLESKNWVEQLRQTIGFSSADQIKWIGIPSGSLHTNGKGVILYDKCNP